jgi:hypothetical protein
VKVQWTGPGFGSLGANLTERADALPDGPV